MVTTQLANIANYTKRRYIGPIRNQVNTQVSLYYLLGDDEEAVFGENLECHIPVRHIIPEGTGGRAEMGQLPEAQVQAHQRSYFTQAFLYGVFELSGPTLKSSQRDSHTFARTLNYEMDALVESLTLDMGRMCHLDGTGFLARINESGVASTVSSTVFDVDEPDIRYLRPGMVIDSYTAKTGGSQNIDSMRITGINTALNRVTLSSAATFADNDYLFREDARGYEFMGLLGIVDADTATTTNVQTLQNIDRSVVGNEFWNATILDNAGVLQPYNEDLLQTAIDDADRWSGQMIDMLLSDHATRREHFLNHTPDRRYTGDKFLKIASGWNAVFYQLGDYEIPWVVDRYAFPQILYGLCTDTLKFYSASDVEWMDEDGAILARLANQHGYKGVLYKMTQLAVDQPLANFAIRNLTLN